MTTNEAAGSTSRRILLDTDIRGLAQHDWQFLLLGRGSLDGYALEDAAPNTFPSPSRA